MSKVTVTLALTLAFMFILTVSCVTAKPYPHIGVYYYAWYGEGRHWNDTAFNIVVDRPIFGYYSSHDENVVKSQLRLIQEAGIDFIIISWWGPNSYEDNSTKLIFSLLEGFSVKACLMVEPFTENPNYTEIYNYIYVNYVSKYPHLYFHFEGNPLILFYNPLSPPPDERFTVVVVGHESYVDWWLWSEKIEARNGCIALLPRFDNSLLPDSLKAIDPYCESGFYLDAWGKAIKLRDEAKVITIYSWNEYHERSAIEPHYDGHNPAFHLYDITREKIQELRTVKEFEVNITNYALIFIFLLVALYIIKWFIAF